MPYRVPEWIVKSMKGKELEDALRYRLDIDDVAALLGATVKQVRYWVTTGRTVYRVGTQRVRVKLPARQWTPRGTLCFDLGDVRRFAQKYAEQHEDAFLTGNIPHARDLLNWGTLHPALVEAYGLQETLAAWNNND
jgi:hypothetical protein